MNLEIPHIPIKVAHFQRSFLLFAGFFSTLTLAAQEADRWEQPPSLTLTGFLDAFYVYDVNQPEGTFRQDFLFNHNRHNEFNLNLGLLGFALNHPRYRARFTIQAGTYANDNYAAEPGVLKNVFEAFAGLSLNRGGTLWVDVGVLPSHIGFESAISIDNGTLTRSLSAENSPYFLTGARVTWSPGDTWQFAALVVNGWQRIQRVEDNSLPSVGTQVVFSPSEGFLLNWSTFLGTDDPDPIRRMRYFNNLYGQFRISEQFGITAGFDIGLQQVEKGSAAYDLWFTPTVIGQYILDARWKTAIRLEYYHDPEGVIIPVDPPNEFGTAGVSWNLDYTPISKVACRLEARWLGGEDPVFRAQNGPEDSDFFIGLSLAVRLERDLEITGPD